MVYLDKDLVDYTGSLDYRAESWTPLYNINRNTGYVVTRVEGLAFFDEDIQNVFADRLIDIPELFFVNATETDSADIHFVFGKFAHRRFIDKDEIVDDPFDIGERPYLGAWMGPNNLLSIVGEGREGGGRFTSKIARGGYGFAFAIKDREGKGFFDRWGFKQAFLVSELDGFGDNFYEATEINKNWGSDENPGQFNVGLVAAQNNVLPVTDGNIYVFFTSLVQKIGKTAAYTRYGVLNSDQIGAGEFNINSLQVGLSRELTKKDTVSIDYQHTNSKARVLGLDNANLISANWKHEFNEHMRSNVFVGFGIDAANAVARLPGTDDNNWTVGFNMQASL